VVESGPVRRTRMNAEQRRESILKAATEVFTVTGYRAGKVADVAAKVGVSEPVIFQNFGSKAALFAAVLTRVAGEVRAELQAFAGHHGSAADLLAHILSPSHVHSQHAPGSRGMLFADAITLTADPDLTEAAKRAVATLADHLADVLRRGQADGDVRADLDPEPAAWLVLSVLSSRPFRNAAMPDGDRLENGVTALVLQALAPPIPASAGASAARPHHG
jgi:AcrR family transcriptional regulator